MPAQHRRPMIFVFGSNKAGIHGAGAARYALLHHGAVMGYGIGHVGNSYAIPTKGQPGSVDEQRGIGSTLPLIEIKQYVDDFIAYAKAHPELQFQVTCIGCGLAGLKHEWVAPMFASASNNTPNLHFDTLWREYLSPQAKFWGTF